jgi:hypothetical protein
LTYRVAAEDLMSARAVGRSATLLAASLLIGAVTRLAQAQGRSAPATIDGVVTDTGLVSLGDATASILGSTVQVVTGANGRFRIVGLPAGQYILVVRHLGYAPTSTALQAAPGDTLRMSFALTRIATALDTVVVTTKRYSMRMAEFEDRRKLGFGHFLTQADIEKRNGTFVSDLLRPILSVRIADGRKRFDQFAVNYRDGCYFQLFLDGVALPTPTNLMDLPTPRELAGIEVYSGPATIPLQYKPLGHKGVGGGGFCGVILIWTKDGS